jgi:hypothetical protein
MYGEALCLVAQYTFPAAKEESNIKRGKQHNFAVGHDLCGVSRP